MQISIEEYLALIENNAVTLIDVREPHEFAQDNIDGAQNIPLSELTNNLDDMDSDTPIILVCLSGKRSLQAATFLKSAGFANVRSLTGGMLAWNQSQ